MHLMQKESDKKNPKNDPTLNKKREIWMGAYPLKKKKPDIL